MINSEHTFNKGKERIFSVSILVAFLGLLANLLKNFHHHTVTLNALYLTASLALGLIGYLYFIKKIKSNLIYSLATSIVIVTVLTGQVLISSIPYFEDILEKHILTNVLYVLFCLIISGFIVGIKLSFAQFLILIVFLIFRSFQVDLPYVSQNLLLIVLMLIGVFIAISFFVKHSKLFVIRVDKQSLILNTRNKEILDNIKYAKRIQTTILPDYEVLTTLFKEYFVFYAPKDGVSNNFYFADKINDTIYFSVITCKGESVSGALMTVVANYGITYALKDLSLTEPNEIAKSAKEFLTKRTAKNNVENDSMELVFCALQNNQLKFTGDKNYLWVVSDNTIEEYGNVLDENKNYLNQTIILNKDAVIYLFSSGVIKQLENKNSFKTRKNELKNLVLRINKESMQDQKNSVNEFWKSNYENEEQVDDICVLAIKM